MDRKVEALNQEKSTIQASLNEEDDYVVEEIAREQMNMKKPGEKVIDIKKPPQQEEKKQEKKGWLEKTRSFFVEFPNRVQFWREKRR